MGGENVKSLEEYAKTPDEHAKAVAEAVAESVAAEDALVEADKKLAELVKDGKEQP